MLNSARKRALSRSSRVLDPQLKILESFDELSRVKGANRGSKVVHCHGVFDLLHPGHLAYFKSAKCLGDILVVTVTSDEYVNKGPGRPYFSAHVRLNMLAALEIIDYVALSRHPTAVPAIEALKPDFYVKGPDYKNMHDDVSGAIYQEEAAVQNHGGKLVFTEDETLSSSKLLNLYFNHWNEEQQKIIHEVKEAGGVSVIEKVIEEVSEEIVLVVGEAIVDTYVFCQPEAISSKSPSVSAKYLFEENYAGGVLAIANHLSDFVKEVRLLTTHGCDSYFTKLVEERLDKRVQLKAFELPNVPTPRKTRFIAHEKSQRIFEITDLRSDQWFKYPTGPFCDSVKTLDNGFIIAADFGHGLFEREVLDVLAERSGFLSINVQTNSSNFGFNPFTKHRKFSFLSTDTREVRIAYHDRFSSPLDLVRRVRSEVESTGGTVAMTLGSSGCYYFPKSLGVECFSPAFADTVIDATGAGDAFFALTSLLVKAKCPDVIVPFLGSIFAGLKTKIIGNKQPVTKAQLLKSVYAILK